ncbi:Hypothetical protein, putative [Bodo saltans]|uniref:Uncharacterized protein n=1 Tax=Bodo saltans TaxID=75058 RepID=A0A0S4IIP5_BODSA|nr:Hypothetical protein, putative [Bodo saltans]|eukprot:CUE72640.1 Hypothetical protein, putative [Bodo saltans]
MSRIRSCEDATSPLLRDAVVAAAPPSTWSPKHLPAATPVVTAHKHSLNPLALCNSRMAVQPTHVSTEPQVTPSLPSAVFNHRSFPTKRYAPLQLPPSVHGDDMW